MGRRQLLAVCALVTLPAHGSAPLEELRRGPVVGIVERVSPAVVNIAAEAIVREADPFFGMFFGPRTRRAQSLGSGLVVDAKGIIVTNAHVIDGASRITISTLAGLELEADVLGSDRGADLAVLRVKPPTGSPLAAVPLGSSADLLIGETVLAIGNPFGLAHTVTTGVLSARGRAVPSEGGERVFTDFLQTDASINPGNSGGPLLNLAGTVIGINTAIVSGASGIGFAIPADRARRVVEDLLRFGELQPLWTGLTLRTVDPELAHRAGLAATRGALVERVFAGSPAARAGLLAGDVVVAIAGRPVTAREDLLTALYSVAVGSPLALAVRRGSDALELSLSPQRPPAGQGLAVLAERVGIGDFEPVRGGLLIGRVDPDSPAASRGLRSGDVVLGADGERIADLEALERAVLRGIERGGILLVIQRGRAAYNLSFDL